MLKIRHIILLFLFVTMLFGAASVYANGDQPDDHHDDVPITEQKREAGEGNVLIVFGTLAVLIIGGLTWEFIIKKK